MSILAESRDHFGENKDFDFVFFGRANFATKISALPWHSDRHSARPWSGLDVPDETTAPLRSANDV